MKYRNFSTEQLRAIDAAHHLHPFTDHRELREAGTRMISRAEGIFVYDTDGNEILDGMAGLWCVNVGYGREELARAAYDQMRELSYYNSFFRSSVPTATLLAERIAAIAPDGFNNVIYGSSGSEANDSALRVVRHYWALKGKPQKNRIISRRSAYHGSTIAGASLGGMAGMRSQLYGAVPNIVHVMPPYGFELAHPGESEHDFGIRAARAIEDAILDSGPETVAGFIAEPVMGAGGVKIAPGSYWPEVQRICRKHDVLIMLDEVITGYGRTGEWFAAQSIGIEADTISTAKALTSGYQPLSALLVSDRIADTLVGKGGEFFHGYTYSGHPVACAVAMANLELIEREGLVERVRTDTGPYLRKALMEALAGHALVGEVRSIGLMAAVEIVCDRETRERFGNVGTAGATIRDQAIAGGLMMRAVGDTMILSPPLVWTRETIDVACEKIRAALDRAEPLLQARA